MSENLNKKPEADASPPLKRIVMRNCATCGREGDVSKMQTCIDWRQMHRYVCDAKCMKKFYA
jgi:hypothetical protein